MSKSKKRKKVSQVALPMARSSRLDRFIDGLVRRYKPIGIALAIGGSTWAAYQAITPTIGLTDSDPLAPFVFPFSIRNGWLPMVNVNWSCAPSYQSPTIKLGGFRLTEPIGQIAARGIANQRCRIGLPAAPIDTFSVVVRVDYEMWGLKRSEEKEFTWVARASRPRWIEGGDFK